MNAAAHAAPIAAGYPAQEISYAAHKIEWRDTNHVLFAGARTNSGQQGVYQWNLRNNEVVELMKAGDGVGMLCYDRGYLHVAFNQANSRIVRTGMLGQQNELVYDRHAIPSIRGTFNPHTCRYQETPASTRAGYGIVTVLRDDHGYIEAEQPSKPLSERKYFLVRPSGVRVSLENFRGAAGQPTFSEFRQAYIFQDGTSDLSGRGDRSLWAVGLDGTTTKYNLPKGPWLSGAARAMPVRNAILIVSPSVSTKSEGAYLVRGGRVEPLIQGVVSSFAVSPDGCKIATNIRTGDQRAGLFVVGICKSSQ